MTQNTKAASYEQVLKQVRSLAEETDQIAVLANVAAVIHREFNFWWTGFYLVKGDELVLGPFQGPVACTRIKKGRGVCGTAWNEDRTIVVPDVEEFPGHIACSSASRSEIVVPMRRAGKIVGVLDIDSEFLSTFDEVDAEWLGKIVEVL